MSTAVAPARSPLSLAALGLLAHEQEHSEWSSTQIAEYYGTTRRVILDAYEELWDKEML
jgi:hypothetical protein